ncbi:hypothetical protein VP01_348g9 [Puccinia sorghi]|uniref:Uncharacterized protein n=1 Tax=Puccinia sorghi TaxID=27349 RepID=A0A0L6UWN0_9BASI|nr:hypothetical protein VP01_348g9 [Puccinia sorghi]
MPSTKSSFRDWDGLRDRSPVSTATQIKTQKPECLRVYFPIHGVHALCSRIECPPATEEEDECENLAYGAKNPVATRQFYLIAHWRPTASCIQHVSHTKFQNSQNPQMSSGIKATLIRFCDRLSKFSNSQNLPKERGARENCLSISISWIEIYHTAFALCNRPTIITVGIQQPGRANEGHPKSNHLSEDCIWSVTEEFIFRENNHVWCKYLSCPSLTNASRLT